MRSVKKIQIQLLLLSQFLVIACLDMADPYWPIILRHNSNTANPTFWTTLVYMAPFLMTIFSAPIWASIGKKFGYKKMLIRASAVLAISQLLIFFTKDVHWIFFLRIVQGTFAGFTASAQAWLVCSSEDSQHGYLIGKVNAFMALGTIFGPVIGGIIAHYFSYRFIFLTASIICITVALLLLFCLSETSKTPSSQFKGLRFNKIKEIRSVGLFWLSFILLSQSLRWMSSSFFALFVIHQIKGSNLTVGILYAVIAVMIYFTAPRWGSLVHKFNQQHKKLKLSLLACLLLAAAAQLIYVISNTISLAVLASCLWGICLGALGSIPFSLLIQKAPNEKKGVMIGFGSSANKLGNLAGIGIGGYIYALSDLHIGFISIALGYAILGAYTIYALKTQRDKPHIIPTSIAT